MEDKGIGDTIKKDIKIVVNCEVVYFLKIRAPTSRLLYDSPTTSPWNTRILVSTN